MKDRKSVLAMADCMSFLTGYNLASDMIKLQTLQEIVEEEERLWESCIGRNQERFLIRELKKATRYSFKELMTMSDPQLEALCRSYLLKERALSKKVKHLCSNFTK